MNPVCASCEKKAGIYHRHSGETDKNGATMSGESKKKMSFSKLKGKIGTDAGERFVVRSRGRPKTSDAEREKIEGRRKAFGSILKKLREKAKYTLARAASEAGIASARKLSQYETTCYPPGWVVSQLAPVYGISEQYLAALTIYHNDPEMFAALSGNLSPEEFVAKSDIL